MIKLKGIHALKWNALASQFCILRKFLSVIQFIGGHLIHLKIYQFIIEKNDTLLNNIKCKTLQYTNHNKAL